MTYFSLYPDVVLVKGALNSLLLDFRSHNYISINNEIALFLFPRIIERINLNEDDRVFIEYLVEKDYGLFCNKKELDSLQPINLSWDYPASITNAIIEIDASSQVDLKNVIQQLSELQCEFIELRINEPISENRFNSILHLLGENGVHGIEIVMPFDEKITSGSVFQASKDNNVFIYSVLMYNTPIDFIPEKKESVIALKYLNRPLTCLDCGLISESNFNVDIPFYAESFKYNTCLNRKLSITANGEIKNCPSFDKSYGNVTNIPLKNVLNIAKFTDLWTINKEQIEVCKDCEFRHVCTDCRAFTENSNRYGKPSKCSYNPYTGEWGDRLNK